MKLSLVTINFPTFDTVHRVRGGFRDTLMRNDMAKKQDFELVPGESLGPVKLGMSRKEVFAALGKRRVSGSPPDDFFDSTLQVEYKNGEVVFVQASRDAPFQTLFKKKNIFESKATSLVRQLSKLAELDEDEPGCSYQFPSVGLVFWREADPDSLKSEMKDLDRSDEEYEYNIEFYKSEIERHSYFETVAVFAEGYYDE